MLRKLPTESVVRVQGTVNKRPDGQANAVSSPSRPSGPPRTYRLARPRGSNLTPPQLAAARRRCPLPARSLVSQDMATGEIEVEVSEAAVLNVAATLPFPLIAHDGTATSTSFWDHFNPKITTQKLVLLALYHSARAVVSALLSALADHPGA